MGAFKKIAPERLRRYATAELAKASGISVRAINAAKRTGSVRYKTWHALVAAMGTCKPCVPMVIKRDEMGCFTK